jgi:hypothetical protein
MQIPRSMVSTMVCVTLFLSTAYREPSRRSGAPAKTYRAPLLSGGGGAFY